MLISAGLNSFCRAFWGCIYVTLTLFPALKSSGMRAFYGSIRGMSAKKSDNRIIPEKDIRLDFCCFPGLYAAEGNCHAC